ncbi:MAG: glycosyl hydrolase family 8, partial [Candidatus Anammoxibacter sp.]
MTNLFSAKLLYYDVVKSCFFEKIFCLSTIPKGTKSWFLGIFLALNLFGCGFTALCNLAYGEEQHLWEEYRDYFINEDGRVVDYYNGHISHSEGQSYGMFLSVTYNDKATFDRLWQWAKDNLGVRADHLFAWKWGERTKDTWGIIDYNNATDGDILIAYALLQAEERWPGSNYKEEGLRIIKSLRENMAINWKDYTFLLPGYFGFNRGDSFVINPSYSIFAAYRNFAKVDENAFWEKVYKDSLLLFVKSRFGTLQLPADWVILNETGISIFNEKKPYFGYEAIRTLLYISWEEDFLLPDKLEKILDIYKKLGYMPLWVDLANDSISLASAPGGFYAVYALAAKRVGEHVLSERLFKEAREKLDRNDYYSFSLYLMAV